MISIDGGLRALFRSRIPTFMWTSIETGGTALGIPDSHYLAPGGASGWIEYKQTDGHAVTLRPEQIGWLLRYARLGGTCWIAVRQRAPAGPRREARDSLHLIPGSCAALARAAGLRDPLHGSHTWSGGPALWDWTAVAALLAA